MWEKEKLLLKSNFSVSHWVFKGLVSQGRQKVSLCGNGLIKIHVLSPLVIEKNGMYYYRIGLLSFGAFFLGAFGVPRGSVVRCLTRNPGVLGSSRTRSSGFYRGSVLGQDTSEPSLVLVKPKKA